MNMSRFKVFKINTSIFLFLGVFLVAWGNTSENGPKFLVNQKLIPCGKKPNCVSSEDSRETHSIAPLNFSVDVEKAKAALVSIIKEMEGEIVIQKELKSTENNSGEIANNLYIEAVFTSKFFKFKDDLALLLNTKENKISLRSASRVGYSDFKVNLKRTQRFRELFEKKLAMH